MGRKPRVDRSPEEKWQIVQEGIKSGNVSETCRRHSIAPNLFYRCEDEAEQGAKAALGGSFKKTRGPVTILTKIWVCAEEGLTVSNGICTD